MVGRFSIIRPDAALAHRPRSHPTSRGLDDTKGAHREKFLSVHVAPGIFTHAPLVLETERIMPLQWEVPAQRDGMALRD